MGERCAALELIETVRGDRRITLGADKGYDSRDFVEELRYRNVTPTLLATRLAAEAPSMAGPLATWATPSVRSEGNGGGDLRWMKGPRARRRRGFEVFVASRRLPLHDDAYNLIRIARLELATG